MELEIGIRDMTKCIIIVFTIGNEGEYKTQQQRRQSHFVLLVRFNQQKRKPSKIQSPMEFTNNVNKLFNSTHNSAYAWKICALLVVYQQQNVNTSLASTYYFRFSVISAAIYCKTLTKFYSALRDSIEWFLAQSELIKAIVKIMVGSDLLIAFWLGLR